MKFYTYAKTYGNNVLVKYYEDGISKVERVPFKPRLFFKGKDTNSPYKDLYKQESLEEVRFADINDAKDYVKRYSSVSGFEVHGFQKWEYQWINETFQGDIKYDVSKMNIAVIDIETVDDQNPDAAFPDIREANIPIVSISIYDLNRQHNLVLGLKPYDKLEGDTFEYKQFHTEEALLKYFIAYNKLRSYDIWTGWNTSFFDIPYIVNRIERLLGFEAVKALSPFGIVKEKEVEKFGKSQQQYEIYGVLDLDYKELYQKFADMEKKENYSLDFIAEFELGKNKLPMSGSSFYDNYVNYFNEFIRYNSVDTELIKLMNDKLKLLELAATMAYMFKCNYQDIYRTIVPWEVFIFNFLMDKGVPLPPRKNIPSKDIAGGWVKECDQGFYGWTMTWDFASLYPHIMWQWNISPETLVDKKFDVSPDDFLYDTPTAREAIDYAKSQNYTLAANGTMYRNDRRGFISEIAEFMIAGRKIAKNEMLKLESEYQTTKDTSLLKDISSLNNKQTGLKLAANSLYGAATAESFYFSDWRLGEAITLTGQLSNKHLANALSTKVNAIMGTTGVDYILAADTDSDFLNCEDLVNRFAADKTLEKKVEFLDNFGKKVCQPVINKSISDIADMMNCQFKVMNSKREAIASKFLFRAKKNYAMYVHNSEGVAYDPPKLKVQGIEIVRSSTPKWCRKQLKTLLQTFFEHDELTLRSRFKDAKDAFYKLTPEEIAFPRGVSDIDKWYDKKSIYISRTPIHVKASLLYNHHTKGKNLQVIKNGDKIKFIMLKMPNPISDKVIGFPTANSFPKELGLLKYVDYDAQFESTFESPLRSLTDVAGWNLVQKNTLDSFFG